jgi:SulP family sulfate permease
LNWRKFIPFLEWTSSYQKSWLSEDLIAGITIGIMVIPQGMAYALLANLPPIYGLYTAIVPMIVYPLLGSSRRLSVGPVAIVALLVGSGVAPLAAGDLTLFVMYAGTLALMVGLIQLAMGVLRLGFLVHFLSNPVISGFTSAIAIIIAFSQLKHLLGIELARSKSIFAIATEALNRTSEINPLALGLGIVGILMIALFKRINRRIPGALLAVLIGIASVVLFGWESQLAIVGEIPRGLPSLTSPDFSLNTWKQLAPMAAVISILSIVQSIAIAKAIQSRNRDHSIYPNQEFVAMGGANIAASFFQSFPVGGGVGRTAVNFQVGARTPLASMISSAVIILTLLFLTPYFFYLPKAILASVIFTAVYSLIDLKEPIKLWNSDRKDFWMLIATFLGTLFVGIEEGILIGVVLSLIMLIYGSTYPHYAVLGHVPDSPYYMNVKRFPGLKFEPGVLIVRFDAQIFFANSTYFKDTICQLIDKSKTPVELLVLDFSVVSYLDSSGSSMLKQFHDELKSRGVHTKLAAVRGPVRDLMNKTGLREQIGRENIYMRTHEAVEDWKAQPSVE